MTLAQARTRHEKLATKIRELDDLYYGFGNSMASDWEYDALYDELVNLEKEFPELKGPNSPTQRVGGAPVEGFERVQHMEPMLSLEKIKAATDPTTEDEPNPDRRKKLQDEKTLDELEHFDTTIRKQVGKPLIEYILEPKVDGVSISVIYRDGRLVTGATRGDGKVGDDITANIRTIRAIPLELTLDHPPKLLEVRGEAFIAIKDFEKLNAKLETAGEAPFPNARNATAGTLKQLDPRIVAKRPIRAVFYALGVCEGKSFETHAEILQFLKNAGLPTQPIWWICNGIQEVLGRYQNDVVCRYDEANDLRTKVSYEIDGIVLKVNNLGDRQKIPSKTRAPGYAIVHKPIPWITPAETVLREIKVQVGRTGVLTPVAVLDPVSVQGSTVSRATLHNETEIRKMDIHIGDSVIIRKAGMVIPEVVEVVKSKRPRDAVEFDLFGSVGGKCPECGGLIARVPKFVSSFSQADFKGSSKFVNRLAQQSDPISAFLWQRLTDAEHVLLTNYGESPLGLVQAKDVVVQALNRIIDKPCIYESQRFKDFSLRHETTDLLKQSPVGSDLVRLNRLLLEDAYPLELPRNAYAWHCQNIAGCPAQTFRRIQFMAQRNALDIEGIGSVVAEKLIETSLIKEWLDLFEIKVEQLGQLNLGTKENPRIFGEKQATKVCDALNRSKSFSLARWLLALGIEDAGETITFEVAKFHTDLEDVADSRRLRNIAKLGALYDEQKAVSPHVKKKNKPTSEGERIERRKRFECLKTEILNLGAELEKEGLAKPSKKWAASGAEKSNAVPEFLTVVGPKVANNIVKYFASDNGKKVLSRLRDLGIKPQGGLKETKEIRSSTPLPFDGQTFVLTGSLKSMTRNKAAEEIRVRGGSVVGAVSKNTDFVIAGEGTGSKLDKAKELGVRIVEEMEFREKLGLPAEDVPANRGNDEQGNLL
jgi:NAD-dependent DNA ligase